MQKSCSRSLASQYGLDQANALSRHLSLCLRSCAGKKALIDGMLVHDETIRAAQEKDVYLSSLVVDLYGKCGALYEAHTWFSQMQERSVFSWNCLISTSVRRAHSMEVMQFFEQMQQECIIPNSATFANVVSVCASKGALIQGMWLHARSSHSHLEAYVVVQTALISMYNKCGKHDNAQMVFEAMSQRDIVSWNAMLATFVTEGDGKSAIQFFAQMQMECAIQDKFTYATMFSACSNKVAVKAGKQLHTCALCSGFEMNDVMVLALVNMYSKCGSVCNARAVFDASSKDDMILWNAVISAYIDNGNGKEVAQLFDRLFEEALLPDKVTFLSALAECASQAAPWHGRQLHVRALATPLKLDIQVETALVHMYGKLGSTADASLMFNSMPEHDIVSWNAMISIYVQDGLMSAAFQHYEQMQEEGLTPNNVTITSVLSGCTDSTFLSLGKHVHALIVSSGLITDVFIGNALIEVYCKCGFLSDAHRHFDSMVSRDTITWNSLIAGYAHNGDTQRALYLFIQMCEQDIVPDQASFVSVLSAIVNEVPPAVSYRGDNTSTSRKSESAPSALYINDGFRTAEMLESEEQMHGQKVASSIAGAKVEEELQSFALGRFTNQAGKLAQGMVLHSYILLNGLDSDAVVEKALLKFYGKCGSLRDSEIMFENLSKRDVISWNLMIVAYILQGHDKEAIQMFHRMQKEEVILDTVTFLNVIDACANMASLSHGWQMHIEVIFYGFDLDAILATALVTLYAKCDSLVEARWIFDHLSERDVVAWTSMIATYVQLGNSEEALELFEQMQSEGVTPDVVSFTSALNACESQSALLGGKLIHTCITHYRVELDADVVIALVYMYGKCGSLMDAISTFYCVSKPNLSLWNALAASYAQHGAGREVLCLLNLMRQDGVIPNSITFVSILCACSRAGLVDEAYNCFLSVFRDNGLAPNVEHYDCMVDLLGRVGQFDEAEDLLKLMPFVPTVVSWASFLATCNNQVNMKRAETATRHLIEMDPVDPVAYVTLSNIYAAAKESDEPGNEERCIGARSGQSVWGEGGQVCHTEHGVY
eukprot:c20379_g1_i1 orf=316-3480(+)